MCNKSADKTGFLYFCMQHSVFLCLLFHCLSKVLGDPRGVQGDWHEPLRPEVRLAIGCSSSPRKGSWLPGRWPSLESQQPPPCKHLKRGRGGSMLCQLGSALHSACFLISKKVLCVVGLVTPQDGWEESAGSAWHVAFSR
jgi:hypothetical protein